MQSRDLVEAHRLVFSAKLYDHQGPIARGGVVPTPPLTVRVMRNALTGRGLNDILRLWGLNDKMWGLKHKLWVPKPPQLNRILRPCLQPHSHVRDTRPPGSDHASSYDLEVRPAGRRNVGNHDNQTSVLVSAAGRDVSLT